MSFTLSVSVCQSVTDPGDIHFLSVLYYRPQGKVTFSEACVILFTISLISTRSLLILVTARSVHIILECLLVNNFELSDDSPSCECVRNELHLRPVKKFETDLHTAVVQDRRTPEGFYRHSCTDKQQILQRCFKKKNNKGTAFFCTNRQTLTLRPLRLQPLGECSSAVIEAKSNLEH